jgi:hypothetical protein
MSIISFILWPHVVLIWQHHMMSTKNNDRRTLREILSSVPLHQTHIPHATPRGWTQKSAVRSQQLTISHIKVKVRKYKGRSAMRNQEFYCHTCLASTAVLVQWHHMARPLPPPRFAHNTLRWAKCHLSLSFLDIFCFMEWDLPSIL